jgi:hypothetical protein
MPKFVTEQITPISVDGDPAIIYIRERLNLGQLQQVQSAGALSAAGVADTSVLGAMWEAYIVRGENITDENGKQIKLTPARIRQLDPDDPLTEAVGDAIAERWKAQQGDGDADERAKEQEAKLKN